MQLEWEPCQLDEALLLQTLNSDRVDVAPGSNIIGEDDQLRGNGGRIQVNALTSSA